MLSFLKVIIAACVFEVVAMAALPSGKMKDFTKNIISLFVVLILLTPIINLIKTYLLN